MKSSFHFPITWIGIISRCVYQWNVKPSNSEHVRNSKETKGIPSAVLLQVKNQARPWLSLQPRVSILKTPLISFGQSLLPSNQRTFMNQRIDRCNSVQTTERIQIGKSTVLLYLMQILNPSESYPFSFRFCDFISPAVVRNPPRSWWPEPQVMQRWMEWCEHAR